MNAGRVQVSHDHLGVMDRPDASCKHAKYRHDLFQIKRQLAELLPVESVIRSLRLKDHHTIMDVCGFDPHRTDEVQQVLVTQKLQIRGEVSRRLMFGLINCFKIQYSHHYKSISCLGFLVVYGLNADEAVLSFAV